MNEIRNILKFSLKAFATTPGEVEFPLKIQKQGLGIDSNVLKNLRGKKVFNPACGSEGILVEYLREKGVLADGMDPRLKNPNGYLEKRLISVNYSGKGSIPKQDNYYDYIYSYAFGQLFYPFSGLTFAKEHWGTQLDSSLILMDLLRVLRPSGKIISYPGMVELSEEFMGIGAPQISIENEVAYHNIDKIIGEKKNNYAGIPELEQCKETIKHRTIIAKL